MAKYTIIGDSIGLNENVWVAMRSVDSTFSWVNRSVSGRGWETFDAFSGTNTPWTILEANILTDNSAGVIIEIGVNNIWEWEANVYMTARQEMIILNKWLRILTALGKEMILGEILPTWPTTNEPRLEYVQKYANAVKERNLLRKKWCAFHGVKLAPNYALFEDPSNAGHPNPALFNVDLIHPNSAGAVILGSQGYALAAVPIITNTYNKNIQKIVLNTSFAYSSLTTRMHTIDLSTITSKNFWDNVNPDGSNLSIYINNIKAKRIIETFCPYAKTGLASVAGPAITELKIKANYDLTETNDTSLYTDTKIIRRYHCHEYRAQPPLLHEVVGNNHSVSNFSYGFYSGIAPRKIDNTFYNYSGALYGNPLVELQSATKFTFNWWMYPTGYGGNMGLFSIANASTNTFKLTFYPGGFSVMISGGSVGQWITPDLQTYIPVGSWAYISLIIDLSQAVPQNRVKLVINGTDRSSLGTVSGTFPSALPASITEQFSLSGNYGNIPIIGGLDNIHIIKDAITVDEAIADYKEQTSAAVAILMGSGVGNTTAPKSARGYGYAKRY